MVFCRAAFLVLISAVIGNALNTETSTDLASRPVLSLVESGPNGLVLEFACDSFSLVEDHTGIGVVFAGAERARPGESDLPHSQVLVGLPQTGGLRVAATALDVTVRTVGRIRPAPSYDAAEPLTISGAGWQPAELVEAGPVGTMRDVRVAPVRINPVQYDAGTGQLRLCRRLRVDIRFTAQPVDYRRADPLDTAVAAALVNGRDALGWKLERRPDDTLNFFDRSTEWCRIRIDTTGVYRITPADLKAAGFSPDGIDPATLRLYTIGPYQVGGDYPDTMVELPLYVRDNGDGRFSGSDAALFYAEAPSRRNELDTTWRYNPYARYATFWLTWGGVAGKRMPEQTGAPAGIPPARALARERVEYDLLCPARSGLLWLWTNLFKPAGVLRVADTFVLPLVERDTVLAVSGRCLGRAPDNQSLVYRGRIYLNGTLLDTLRIPAASRVPPQTLFNIAVPGEAGSRGSADTVVFELYGEPEMDVFVDWFEVQYLRRLSLDQNRPWLELWGRDSAAALEFALEGGAGALVMDVSDPWNPLRIQGRVDGRRLLVSWRPGRTVRLFCVLPDRARSPAEIRRRTPGMLRRSDERADYYIIAPDELAPAAELLARWRNGNIPGAPGAVARVARLESIYDDYGFGMQEPAAIRRFLQAKRPAYVLLAGDGSYDYQDRLGLGLTPGVPPCELGYDIDPEVYGNTARAQDAWYADLDAGGLIDPDLALGRVTARSAVELRAFYDKLRRYESQPPGFWSRRFLLVADDEWLGQVGPQYVDPIGFRHISSCELMATVAPGLLDPVKLYLTEYPLTSTNLKAEAQAELLRRLDEGALLWAFFGHGAGFQLCHEQILHITNTVPQVKTGLRQSVAYFGSCGVGRFDDTRYQSIAEELVRREEGCIATVAATKATDPGGNEALARQLFTFLTTRPEQPVGAAFFAAWNTNPLYHLFGDPVAKLRLPAAATPPTVSPESLYPGGQVSIAGSAPVSSGSWELAAFEEEWLRRYFSDVGVVFYRLNGYNLMRAMGRIDSGRVQTSFVVPRVDYPETTLVPNGSYVRQAGTGRVSLLMWNQDSSWSATRGGLGLGDSLVEPDDNAPPEIELWADRIRLRLDDTTDVPGSFVLTGVISDPSGILLVPDVEAGLSLQIGTAARVQLGSVFAYDNNSTTTGRFSWPVRLDQRQEVITVTAADNLVTPLSSHRRVVQVAVRKRSDDALTLADPLVYPNPTPGAAKFTFNLSRPAYVSVRIFTLAGRLVRALPEQICGPGYGELEWDGFDAAGRLPGNGVYLYKIDARAVEPGLSLSRSSATYRDRFIIHR